MVGGIGLVCILILFFLLINWISGYFSILIIFVISWGW